MFWDSFKDMFFQIDSATREEIRELRKILREKQDVEEFRYTTKKDHSEGCVIEIYRDEANEWRWRLKARNRKIIAEGGEGYKRKAGLLKSLNLIRLIIDTCEQKEIK